LGVPPGPIQELRYPSILGVPPGPIQDLRYLSMFLGVPPGPIQELRYLSKKHHPNFPITWKLIFRISDFEMLQAPSQSTSSEPLLLKRTISAVF
jgi:hypothetical protein